MKVLFYNHTGQVSGAERVMLLVLAKLNRSWFTPEVICPAAGQLKQEVTDLDVPWAAVDSLSARFTWRPDHLLRYLGSFLRLIRQVRARAKSARPELIQANSVRAGLVTTMATVGSAVPVIWHVHDMLPRHPLSTAIRLLVFCSRRTRVIAISQAVGAKFRGTLLSASKQRITVVLNAVDLDKFQPDLAGRIAVRQELGLSSSDIVIGTVGQITARKGQQELLEAFTLVVKQLPRATLLIIGAPLFNKDDEYLQRLKQTVEDLALVDRVRFLGARDDIAALTNALDLLVVNSLVEPFGLVVVEGLACGTPVLATAVDGIPEIINHENDGWLVPAKDKQMLASAIVKLLKHPELRAGLALRGMEKARTRFTAERYMREIQGCYLQTGWNESLSEREAVVQSEI